MRCYYKSFIEKSDQDTVDHLTTFFGENDIFLVNFNRQQYGPTEHQVEIWYHTAEDNGYGSNYCYFRGGSSRDVTSKVLTFFNTGEIGYGYFNRQVVGPSDHLFDIWWSTASDSGVVGGFSSFRGKNYQDTTLRLRDFFQENSVEVVNQQRTILSSGYHVIDIMYTLE
jgi:hypothetical protein